MSTRRAPAPAPDIPGYRYDRVLGSGGFADVYLYEQDRPRRKVAVKVLLSDLRTDSARRAFETEANLMAQLSSHPAIVTIYEADTTADGHSYLAMEYCSRPSLDVRYRRGRLNVAETLAIGIQLASAVETAHRAGIIHRDIKPANVLITDYNRPALTDFGISGTIDGAAGRDEGMSIPWSPPEVLQSRATNGVAADVWSLGATIYTLFAGRSPFVLPGGDNSQAVLMDRIANAPLSPLNRHDVPDSLELALVTAMAKDPAARFQSAYSFALALQRVQAELGLSVTPFDVLDDSRDDDETDDDGPRTRVRKIVSIDPAEAAAGASAGPFGVPVFTRPGQDDSDDADHTVLRPVQDGSGTAGNFPEGFDGSPSHNAHPAPAKRRVLIAAGVAAVVLAGTAGAVAVGQGMADTNRQKSPVVAQAPADAVAGLEASVPAPRDWNAMPDGGLVTFTWTNPDPQEGDLFRYRSVTLQDEGDWQRVREARVEVAQQSGGPTCIDLQLTRANGTASDIVRPCWEGR